MGLCDISPPTMLVEASLATKSANDSSSHSAYGDADSLRTDVGPEEEIVGGTKEVELTDASSQAAAEATIKITMIAKSKGH